MNKTIKRKLILSGLTLAIAGFATASTTYAWFTANSTVSATGVEGTVADDASIYVKLAGDTNFGSTVNLSADGIIFTPVQKTASGAGYQTIKGETADTSGYMQFTLNFTGPTGTRVGLSAANFTQSQTVPSFVLKADAGTDDSVKLGESIQVSVLDALAMSITTTTATTNYKVKADTDTDYDGLTYYNNVIGGETVTLADPATYSGTALTGMTTPIELGSIPSSGTLDVTFTIFLNGWDKDCFDAICSQVFQAAFTFGVISA